MLSIMFPKSLPLFKEHRGTFQLTRVVILIVREGEQKNIEKDWLTLWVYIRFSYVSSALWKHSDTPDVKCFVFFLLFSIVFRIFCLHSIIYG